MYDVCIVGAGPAGSTLARLIGDRYRVLLVDRRSDTGGSAAPSKLCGGLLAPRAQAELARQGLGVPAQVVEGPQLFAVRTLDVPARLERTYQRHYLNVDRGRFDAWLLSLAGDRVDVACGWNLTGMERGAGSSMLRFATPGGGRASVEARLVVGADGAASAVRSAVTSRRPARYTAVQAVFSAAWGEASYGAVFDERLTDFYGWTIPKGDAVAVGAAFPAGRGSLERFDAFVGTLRHAGFALGAELSRASAPIARPQRFSDVCLGGPGVALVGEAAGLISPSSAEGISFALRSAARLADSLAPGIEGARERYRGAAAGLTLEVCAKLVKSSAIYGPLVRREIMRSGVGSLKTPPVRAGAGVPGVA